MIERVAFEGYRSLAGLTLELRPLNVITGENGAGKSNVYRALRLLAYAVEGRLAHALAQEGGMPSAMWAGERTKRAKPTRLSVGFSDDEIAFELRIGLPSPPPPSPPPPFSLDPEVKEETIRSLGRLPRRLLERRGQSVTLRDHAGARETYAAQLDPNESILSQIVEPHRYPVLSVLRERIKRWRFYHRMRTDVGSALRSDQIGTLSPILAHDGSNLAAALATIIHLGAGVALDEAVYEALGGAKLDIEHSFGRFRLGLDVPGIKRTLYATELSDGDLNYLALLAALQSPRPPELLVLNEPETSLNSRALPALAKQIVGAARRSQVVLVSHSNTLVDEISRLASDVMTIRLAKRDGATTVPDRSRISVREWEWSS